MSLDEVASSCFKYEYSEAPRLVHRLDRDCSGILVMGRTQTSTTVLHSLFHEKTAGASDNERDYGKRFLQKRYLALVFGSPRCLKGTIDVPLKKVLVDDGKSERITIGERSSSAQHAVTDYRVIETTPHGYTWLELSPLTGRKHQLRVHCAEVLRTPIVGDYKYGWQAHRQWRPFPGIQTSHPSKFETTHSVESGSITEKQPGLHLHCKQMVLPNISLALQQASEDANFDFSNLETVSLVAPLPWHMQRSWDILNSLAHQKPYDLYCVEEESLWEDLEVEKHREMATNQSLSLLPILMLNQDLFWDNEEILTLFSREKQICDSVLDFSSSSPSLLPGRGEAVEWMLKANSYYAFSTLTATLSINYLDKFLISSPYLHHHNQPWMIQLAAVACLSLAAKVEEVDVPLLLDLQVAGAGYMFEAKSIQKMELLILSTLNWKMHPVTPISFLDLVIPQLGLKCNLHREFHRRSEQLLLSVIAGSSVLSYLPSILATAIMMHVIDQIEPSNAVDYHNQLMGLLNLNKEKVKSCYGLLVEKVSNNYVLSSDKKRNRGYPSSPNGVIDSHYFGSNSATESWSVGSSTSSSLSSSPHQHAMKRNKRVHEQYMPLRVFVDAVWTTALN